MCEREYGRGEGHVKWIHQGILSGYGEEAPRQMEQPVPIEHPV